MKAIAVFLVLFFLGVLGIFNPGRVGAVEVRSWMTGAPTVVKNVPTVAPGSECSGVVQSVYIFELRASYLVCHFGDERLRIGYFSNHGSYQGVVSFPYSSDTHTLEGICSGIICRYSADQDLIVTQQQISQFGWGIVVYLHVSERIKQIRMPSGEIKYVFDGTNPDYLIKNDVGRYIWTAAYGLSDNGKWLVVELRDAGLVVINTDTFVSRQIIFTGRLYGVGSDPSTQLAISNNGKTVAEMGTNTGFAVIEVNDDCGQKLIGDLSRQPNVILCRSSEVGISTIFPNFRFAEHPRFYGDGYQLDVTVDSWGEGRRQVTLLAHGAALAHTLKLLALGDSFTSGEGETDVKYYEIGTNDRYDTCHVSKRSYPLVVAASIGIGIADAKSVACAGARIRDLVGSDTYWGQKNRLSDAGLKLADADRLIVQQQALSTFQPGRTLQSEFIDRYNPEMIIIGVGGNDAGLVGKLNVCAMPGTCEWAKGDGLKATAGEIRRLYNTLGSLFANISTHHPTVKVYIVGYPNIIKADGTCSPVTRLLLDYSERIFIENGIHYLNQVIHSAAQKANFTYLDVEQSMRGRNLCSGSSLTAMNELRFGNDIPIISAIPMLKVIGSETFHPTPIGHALVADTILAGHPGLHQDRTCLTDPMACIIPPISIQPPAYWGVDSAAQSRESFFTDFVTPVPEIPYRFKIASPKGVFQPGSNVTVEVRSESTSIGNLVVDQDGSVGGVVMMPVTLETGFHTLHLLGSNREGLVVDLYQFVTLGEDIEITSVGIAGRDPVIKQANDMGFPKNEPSEQALTDVLGAKDSGHSNAFGTPRTSNPLQNVKHFLSNKDGFIWVIAGGIAIIILAVVLSLFIRGWAKSTP